MVEVERARTIQRQRTKVESFHRVPTPHEKFDEYKTEMLIEDDRFKLDLDVEPRPAKYVTKNTIQPVLSLPTVRKDGKFTLMDSDMFEDYLQRKVRKNIKFPEIITAIDFTRPYDLDYFRSLVDKPNYVIDVVNWSEEGIGDPGTGLDKVVKIILPPNEAIVIGIPIPVLEHPIFMAMLATADDGVVAYVSWQTTRRFYVSETSIVTMVHYFNGTSTWDVIRYSYGSEHYTMNYLNIKITNTTSSYKTVYIAYLFIVAVEADRYSKGRFYSCRVKLNNATIRKLAVLYARDLQSLWLGCVLRSDGTNTLSVTIEILTPERGYVQVTSWSTTSSSFESYAAKLNIVNRTVSGRYYPIFIRYTIETAGTGEVIVRLETEPTYKQPKVVNLAYDSNTQSIDAGQSSTFVIFDYTTSTKYANVKRIILERDSEQVDLIVKDENGNILAQLKGSYPGGSRLILDCQHEFKDLLKLVVDVTNNDTANAHNIRIYVEYEEVDALLVK